MGTLNLGSSGTITNLAVGGVPDNTIDNGTLADDSVGVAELSATGTASSSTFLRGDNSWADPGGGGPIVYDEWRLTDTFYTGAWAGDDSSGIIRYNIERSDTPGFNQIGTGFNAPSSGVYTFPSTGWWDINFQLTTSINNAINAYTRAYIMYTSDNASNWSTYAESWTNNLDGNTTVYATTISRAFLKITDLTNQKFNLTWNCHNYGSGTNDVRILGSTERHRTGLRAFKWLEI